MPRISVAVRIRPDSNASTRRLENLKISEEKKSIELMVSETQHNFNFDNVLDESSTQTNVYELTLLKILDNVMEGYNGCVFAYGQTGAG